MHRFYLILIFITLPFHSFAKEKKLNFILDTDHPLSNKMKYRFDQVKDNYLNGYYKKNISILKTLLSSLIANDKQVLTIQTTILLIDQYLALKNFTVAKKISNQLIKRSKHFLFTNKKLSNTIALTLAAYANLIDVVGFKNYSQSKEDSLLKIIKQSKEIKLNRGLSISNYTLAYLYLQQNKKEDSLKYAYQAAYYANNSKNFYYYYLASKIITLENLKQNKWSAVHNRITVLYTLFSNQLPSIYYKIKVLMLLIQYYEITNDSFHSCQIATRIKDILSQNSRVPHHFQIEITSRLKKINSNFCYSIKPITETLGLN